MTRIAMPLGGAIIFGVGGALTKTFYDRAEVDLRIAALEKQLEAQKQEMILLKEKR